MSNEPPQDNAGDTSEFTGPIWNPGQPETPGDYVMLGGPPRPAHRPRKLAIGASIAALAMLAGAGAAYAVSTSGAPHGAVTASSSGSSPSANPGHGPFHWRCQKSKSAMCSSLHVRFPFRHIGFLPGGLFGGLVGGMLGAVHGQMVLAKPGGGYVTVDLQRGKVTAVSSTSITLRSTDGFSASYAVAGATVVGAQRAGLGSVKVGDEVSLQATVKGSTATATSIIDLTLLKKNHPSIGFGWSGFPPFKPRHLAHQS